MRIKRFVGPDMRSVFRMVRDEQGADAVILSNRSVAGGVEVLSATDFDPALAQDAIRALMPPERNRISPMDTARDDVPRSDRGNERSASDWRRVHTDSAEIDAPLNRAKPAINNDARRASFSEHVVRQYAEPADASDAAAQTDPQIASVINQIDRDESQRRQNTLTAVPVRISPWDEDPSLRQVRDELASMRTVIEREMQRYNDERLRGSPARASAMALMNEYGCDEHMARALALRIASDADVQRTRGLVLCHLAKMIPTVAKDPLEEPGVIALIGPTGAGKTTTIAKLAGAYADKYGSRNIALVTTDTMRPGGREQLHAYGRQLGVTVVEAGGQEALMPTLERLADYRMVLIDTVGHGPRDRALSGQLTWLRAAGKVRSILVMPANSHPTDLEDVVRRYRGVVPEAAVLTKVDETFRLGGAISVLARHGMPLAWTTDGQKVPNDIARAEGAALALRLESMRREAHTNPETQSGGSHAVA